MAHRGGEFVRGEHEAAVAGDRHHRHVAPRVLRAERGGEAPAEIVLIARREKGPRLVDREGEPRGEADLRDFVDEDAVLRQFGADRFEEGDLRRELVEALAPCGLALLHLGRARRPLGVVRRQRGEQAAQDRRGVADQRDGRLVQAVVLLGVGIDADDRRARVDAPVPELGSSRVPTPSTTSASPHSSRPSGSVDAERIAAVEHAAAAPIGEHRRLQHRRQRA